MDALLPLFAREVDDHEEIARGLGDYTIVEPELDLSQTEDTVEL
jgi:hypothetical protein